MKRIIFITIWLSLLGIAACAPRPGDPAATILPNQQRALELLGKWRLTQLQNGNTPQSRERRALTFQNAQIVQARLNETFELRGGQSVELTDAPTRLGITFEYLVSDQRCPQDMACYWAGEARLQISFREDDMEHPPLFELTTNQRDLQHQVRLTTRQAYEVELLALEPPRKTGRPIPFEQYVAMFRVTHTAPTATLAPPHVK